MTQAPPLVPSPLDQLLGRVAHEWQTRKRIFDLPTARFFEVGSGPDLSTEFMGRTITTPIGPAAGPHSQLAENLVLAWLGGSRLFELKTVQVLDELEIGRPCIDMETIGFNIEWSQELRIPQSLDEYVKAWMIIEILRGWDELTPFVGEDPGSHVFDMSVGYDLAGISSPSVAEFIDSLTDATSHINRLRHLVPAPFDRWRDHEFPSRIADTVTLSTFHGCPPDEIESICRHLMQRHGLDVVVKLNPTLLGYERVTEIVNGELGHDEILLRRPDFDADLRFDRALELIEGLRQFAASEGRRFGIKLTNTLVVGNHKGFLPDETMYMSGPPLHVVSMTLLDELAGALPGTLAVGGHEGDVQVSFSAGITKANLPAATGLGLAPVTVCSDLLQPGGYGRLKPMLVGLGKEMEAAGCNSLAEWRDHFATASGPGGPIAAYVATLHDPATNGPYTKEGTGKLPRSVDHTLEMWGCVACNFCVTVCPNDAFFQLRTPDDLDLPGRQQYFVLAELCNECGNCMVFCPEVGDPATVKPRLYTDPARFALGDRPGFLVGPGVDSVAVTPHEGLDEHVPRLTGILSRPEGLPLDRTLLKGT